MTPLYGLLLAGGQSKRMGQDKATLEIAGQSLLERTFNLLQRVCASSFISVRELTNRGLRSHYPQLADQYSGLGPADGIASAQQQHPQVAWLVLACDLPALDQTTLDLLIQNRNPDCAATAFRSSTDGLPEPLCAIYEAHCADSIKQFLATGVHCPRKMLLTMDTQLIELPHSQALYNANTPADWSHTTGLAL